LEKGKIKWLLLPLIAAVFAAAVAVSTFFGGAALTACLWATAAASVAAIGSLAPVVYSVIFRPSMLMNSALVSGAIRLLLMLAGAVTILLLVRVDVLWFIAWLIAFYMVTVLIEVCFILRAVNENKQGDGF
jgi:hypothetical protein